MKIIATLVFGLYMANLLAQNPTFLPAKELSRDTSLTSFVARLKAAATNQDIKYLTSVLDTQVSSGFDGNDGIKSFLENWGLLEDSTKFWRYLTRALETGGAFVNDPNDETGRYQVVFPYVYNFEPGLEDDYYALGCITGSKVNLRDQPDIKGKVLTQLNYDVVWYIYNDPEHPSRFGKNLYGDPEWYLVETYNKAFKGWVNWKFVYSMVGPRLFLFKNQAGLWRVSSFVDGD